METVEASFVGGEVIHEQSAEDQQWGLVVGDVVQIVQGRSKKYTYALYCGRGRVIHVWSPSRQNFRVRVDSLRTLKASGYEATICSRELDEFFHDLFYIAPVEPIEAIRRAKTALHTMTASRASNLSFILFARYGDTIFTLYELLKEAYWLAFDGWVLGLSNYQHQEKPNTDESHLDSPVRPIKPGIQDNNQFTTPIEPAIKVLFGSVGDLLMSVWLEKSLDDIFEDSRAKCKWYSIHVPPAIICLTPLSLQYDIQQMKFRVRYNIARGLPQRLAGDRMECGICWTNFTPLKVMLFKCQHYVCNPCLRLLPRKECPYCRGPIRFAQPVSELVKREATRLLMEAMEFEDKIPVIPKPDNIKDNNRGEDEP